MMRLRKGTTLSRVCRARCRRPAHLMCGHASLRCLHRCLELPWPACMQFPSISIRVSIRNVDLHALCPEAAVCFKPLIYLMLIRIQNCEVSWILCTFVPSQCLHRHLSAFAELILTSHLPLSNRCSSRCSSTGNYMFKDSKQCTVWWHCMLAGCSRCVFV